MNLWLLRCYSSYIVYSTQLNLTSLFSLTPFVIVNRRIEQEQQAPDVGRAPGEAHGCQDDSPAAGTERRPRRGSSSSSSTTERLGGERILLSPPPHPPTPKKGLAGVEAAVAVLMF